MKDKVIKITITENEFDDLIGAIIRVYNMIQELQLEMSTICDVVEKLNTHSVNKGQ